MLGHFPFLCLTIAAALLFGGCNRGPTLRPLPLKREVKRRQTPVKSLKFRIYHETFPDPLLGWRQRFFHRWTDGENYYIVSSGDRPGYRPSNTPGLWIAKRGLKPLASHHRLTLKTFGPLASEAAYLRIGINSHLARTTVRFLDRQGVPFAETCLPKTNYYVYTPVAVTIRHGLSAIIIDGHGKQVPGNININDITVIIGELPPDRQPVLHLIDDRRCVTTEKPYSHTKVKHSPPTRDGTVPGTG